MNLRNKNQVEQKKNKKKTRDASHSLPTMGFNSDPGLPESSRRGLWLVLPAYIFASLAYKEHFPLHSAAC